MVSGPKLIENQFINQISKKFELYGFSPIETRAFESLDWLLKKGETDKEIYTIGHLQNKIEEKIDFGLHFDLTIPFARYVAQNKSQLQFPFKRYQIQKVWRGEKPQKGRFREFYQADADVVGEKDLPLFFDPEMIVLLSETLSSLSIPLVLISVNNRKILEGYCQGLGIEKFKETLNILDKLEKIGSKSVGQILKEKLNLSENVIQKLLGLIQIKLNSSSDLIFQLKKFRHF
jgi:histidyl-tRNA synthetase